MNRHLPPLILQLLGVAIIVAMTVFYFITLQASLTISGVGLSLATLGTVQRLFSAAYEEVAQDATGVERTRHMERRLSPGESPTQEDDSCDESGLP